jgi:hypothetical protein
MEQRKDWHSKKFGNYYKILAINVTYLYNDYCTLELKGGNSNGKNCSKR